MTNNIEQIRKLLVFNDKDDFYFVQIIQRRKENPDLHVGSIVLRNFYIDSLEDFDKQVPIMFQLCEKYNARAYIRLNKRNYRDLSLKMIKRTVDYMSNNNHKGLRNVFDAVAGEFHSEKDKTWVIDVDNDKIEMASDFIFDDQNRAIGIKGKSELSKIVSFVTELQIKTKREPKIEFIPTKNGIHLITRPFNLNEFKKNYPNIDVHKDAPTLIYCS